MEEDPKKQVGEMVKGMEDTALGGVEVEELQEVEKEVVGKVEEKEVMGEVEEEEVVREV